MLKRIIIVGIAVAIAAAAALLYKPVSILVFHIMEPKFICPVDTPEIKIRSDGWGEGASEGLSQAMTIT